MTHLGRLGDRPFGALISFFPATLRPEREAGDRSETCGAPVWCRSSSRLSCRQRRRADHVEVR